MPEEKEQAILWQEQHAQQVISENYVQKPRFVAGADVSYGKHGEKAFSSVVVMDISTGEVVETATWVGKPPHNYKPGFFALREVPCLLKTFEKLQTTPDVVLIDGNGLIHKRRFGLACHIGLCLDVPTIGCAKSLLVGNHKPLSKKEPSAYISHMGDKIGIAMRKNREVIYVSVGHKVDLSFVKNFMCDLPTPTPIDHAHNSCSKLFKEDQQHQKNEKDQDKAQIIATAKELKSQGLSYVDVAKELNNYKDLRAMYGKKFTPRKIRNWLEQK